MRTRVLLVVALLAFGACSDDGGGDADEAKVGDSASSSSPTATADAVEPLPTGKHDLQLEATSHLSPEGFEPGLRLDLQYSGLVGWTSVHRGADAFDLGLPDATGDAPLFAAAFLVSPEATAEDALAAVRDSATQAGAQVRVVTGPFDELGATAGVDIVGGQRQVVASSDGGIALDAIPGARLQVFGTDEGGSPLLVVVFAPDAAQWPEVKDDIDRLSSALSFA